MENINSQILQEIREFRKEVNDTLRSQGERIAHLESDVAPLLDNGQPGRVSKLEDEVAQLSKFRYLVVGIATILSGFIHFIWPHK